MALTVRLLDAAEEPVPNVPVELVFNGSLRYHRVSDEKGEIHCDPCPGPNVFLVHGGVVSEPKTCHDGLVLDFEI